MALNPLKNWNAVLAAASLLLSGLATAQPESIAGGSPATSPAGSSITRPRPDWDFDGKRILGHIGFDIYIWDAQTGNVLDRFIGHRERILRLQFSPDGKSVLSSSGAPYSNVTGYNDPKDNSRDTSTRLWDIASGKQIWELDNHIAGKFSRDGNLLITFLVHRPFGDDADIVVSKTETGKQLLVAAPEYSWSGKLVSGSVWEDVAFSSDGTTFITLMANRLNVFDTGTGRLLGHIQNVDSFNFQENSSDFCTFGERGVEVWSRAAKRLSRLPLEGEQGKESSWTRTSDHIAYIRFEKLAPLKIWDIKTNAISTEHVPTGDLLIDPTGKRLLVWTDGESDGGVWAPMELFMYDIATGKLQWHVQAAEHNVLGFSPNGKSFLAGGGAKFSVYESDSGARSSSHDLLGSEAVDGFGECIFPRHANCSKRVIAGASQTTK